MTLCNQQLLAQSDVVFSESLSSSGKCSNCNEHVTSCSNCWITATVIFPRCILTPGYLVLNALIKRLYLANQTTLFGATQRRQKSNMVGSRKRQNAPFGRSELCAWIPNFLLMLRESVRAANFSRCPIKIPVHLSVWTIYWIFLNHEGNSQSEYV